VEYPGFKQKVLIALYKYAFRKVYKVFFQNTENQQFFIEHNIAVKKQGLLPGSGVNLKRFPIQDYPESDAVRFAFISRIMKEKGIEQYLDAAVELKDKYPFAEFHLCGFCEKEYEGKLNEYAEKNIVIYHGMIRNVSAFLKNISCVVHPTYYPEGISNVLLEACASGRPIITTDRAGCREVVEDGITGFVCRQKDSEDLVKQIEKFLEMPLSQRRDMGLAGRRKVEREFDRQIVVNTYMEEISKILDCNIK